MKGFANSQKYVSGFIMMEALIGISMITGVWLASTSVYQRLILASAQQESWRLQLGKEKDAYEVQEHARANLHIAYKGVRHDTARVPSRHRSMRNTTQSPSKN